MGGEVPPFPNIEPWLSPVGSRTGAVLYCASANLAIPSSTIEFARPWTGRYALRSYEQELKGLLAQESVEFLLALPVEVTRAGEDSTRALPTAQVDIFDLYGNLSVHALPLQTGAWSLHSDGIYKEPSAK